MWFESYLSERKQYVEVKGSKSEQYTSSIGVPQGGVLSAILFILFTNDIVEATNKLSFSIYADDTCLIIAVDRDQYNETLKNELEKVVDWFSSNSLLLNVNKTEYIFFGPHYAKKYDKGEHDLVDLHYTAPVFLFDHHDPHYDGPNHIQVNKKGEFILQDLHSITPRYFNHEHIIDNEGNITESNDKVKYLGIYIDEKLHFKYHINIVCCKINKVVGTLWKCLHLDIETKKIIYHSLAESHLNYGIVTWSSELGKNLMLEKDMDHIPERLLPVRTAQNKVLRAVFGKSKKDKNTNEYTASSPLYKELDVLKFHDLYYYNICILVYDYFKCDDFPDAIRDIFIQPPQVNYELRNDKCLTYKVPNQNNAYRKPSIAGTIMWNKLPEKIRNSQSKTSFKKALKKHFIDKY